MGIHLRAKNVSSSLMSIVGTSSRRPGLRDNLVHLRMSYESLIYSGWRKSSIVALTPNIFGPCPVCSNRSRLPWACFNPRDHSLYLRFH